MSEITYEQCPVCRLSFPKGDLDKSVYGVCSEECEEKFDLWLEAESDYQDEYDNEIDQGPTDDNVNELLSQERDLDEDVMAADFFRIDTDDVPF